MHFKMFSTISELYQLDGLDASLALSNTLSGGRWGGGGSGPNYPLLGTTAVVINIVSKMLLYQLY